MKIGDEVEVLSMDGIQPQYAQHGQLMIGHTWFIEDFTTKGIALFTITNEYHRKFCVSIPVKNLRPVK